MAWIIGIGEKIHQTLLAPLGKPLRVAWMPQALAVLSLVSATFASWPLALSAGGIASLSWKLLQDENEEAARRVEQEQRKPLLSRPSEGLDFPGFYGGISSSSDLLEDRAVIDLLKDLRKRGRLLSQREFAKKLGCFVCKSSGYIGKGFLFERILGADYIVRTAQNCGLGNLIRVPIKYAVLDLEDSDDPMLHMKIRRVALGGCSSRDLAIYAEKILPINRKATQQEMASLFQVLLESGFTDCSRRNFILGRNRAGEEGIFFIDTEMNSFSMGSPSEVNGFYDLMASEDHVWLADQIGSFLKEVQHREQNDQSSKSCKAISRMIEIRLSDIFG